MKTIKISDVAATSLLTLYCHALESQSRDPILRDPKAVAITEQLNRSLDTSNNKLYRKLVNGRIPGQGVISIAIRARHYDECVRDFLKNSPEGVVVDIGCGLDSRFLRIDNGSVNFYDLDLPEVIELKKQFYRESNRYHFIASSVLDHSWMKVVSNHRGPFLFVAEGVFMYLPADDVKKLVLKLQEVFPGCELVFEAFNSMWMNKYLKWIIDFKLHKELQLGKDVSYHFGIHDGKELEGWNSGIELLDEWGYLESGEKKLGLMKLFKNSKLFNRSQWTVHYKLNAV